MPGRREDFEVNHPDLKEWKARYEALTREEARKRLAFFSLPVIDQEQTFQLVVELQHGDRRVHLRDMITAWEWAEGKSL